MIGQRKNILKLDWVIILLYFLLLGFGVGNILSSSISGEEVNFLDLSNLYSKQLLYALTSIFLGFIAISIEVKFYERFSSIFYLISLIVLLCLFLFGKRVNGALSWFPIVGFNLQPSEFVKITVALAVSKYISDFQTDLKNTNDHGVLLVSNLKLLNFKFKSLKFKGNRRRFFILFISIPSLVFLGVYAIPVILSLYILISIFTFYKFKTK